MGDSVSFEQSPAGQNLGGAKWEMRFYEDILKRNPDYVEVLMLLGNLYTGRKMYAQGLQVDQRLATLKKDDPIVHYNLACSHSLLKQVGDAFRALSRPSSWDIATWSTWRRTATWTMCVRIPVTRKRSARCGPRRGARAPSRVRNRDPLSFAPAGALAS